MGIRRAFYNIKNTKDLNPKNYVLDVNTFTVDDTPSADMGATFFSVVVGEAIQDGHKGS